jgi:hypothetical protein
MNESLRYAQCAGLSELEANGMMTDLGVLSGILRERERGTEVGFILPATIISFVWAVANATPKSFVGREVRSRSFGCISERDMAELQSWWQGLPPVTKWFFGTSVVTTLLTHIGVFDVYRLLFQLEPIYQEFQVRRLFWPNFSLADWLRPCFGIF